MNAASEAAKRQVVPDVGSLVEYGMNSFKTGPAHYRVTAWMRVAPPPDLRADDFIGRILFEACQEIRDVRDGGKKRMQFCLREEATHLSLAGISGAIAPIEMCKVTGMVDWPEDQIEEDREQAKLLGSAHEMIF